MTLSRLNAQIAREMMERELRARGAVARTFTTLANATPRASFAQAPLFRTQKDGAVPCDHVGTGRDEHAQRTLDGGAVALCLKCGGAACRA